MDRCQAQNKADKPILNDKAGSLVLYMPNQRLKHHKPNPLGIATRQLNDMLHIKSVRSADGHVTTA